MANNKSNGAGKANPAKERFAIELSKGTMSPSEAYTIAYGRGRCTEKTLAEKASTLKRDPYVARRMLELRQLAVKEFVVEKHAIIQEAAALAFLDSSEIFDESGKLIPPKNLPKHVSKAIQSIEVNERFSGEDRIVTYKYKFWDKNQAMEKLFKHLGLFEKDNRQTGEGFAQALYGLVQGTKPQIRN